MSETETPEYAESREPVSADVAESVGAKSLLVRDIRNLIASLVGINTNPRTRFGKKELNSIHAYLTGEWYYPKRDYNTPESPPAEAVRIAVAVKAPVEDYIPSPNDAPGEVTRPFNKSELIDLLETLQNQGDKRPKPGK